LTGTLAPMQFGSDVAAKGVRERSFEIWRAGRLIPGVLWTASEDERPRPVVMLGHGASGTKREDYIVSLARTLVRHHGLCAVAIDGPVQGDRDGAAGPDFAFAAFAARWSSDPDLIDDMVGDWRATLDAVQALPEVSAGPCGWWGLSMGTIFGLPVVAAEPRVAVAVLGLMGISGPTRERFAADAPTVRCPVLFVAQWHDELFPRQQVFELFEALGSPDKRMHVHPGMHGEVPAEEFEASRHILAAHLVG
jgi:dienelactone hydrolase